MSAEILTHPKFILATPPDNGENRDSLVNFRNTAFMRALDTRSNFGPETLEYSAWDIAILAAEDGNWKPLAAKYVSEADNLDKSIPSMPEDVRFQMKRAVRGIREVSQRIAPEIVSLAEYSLLKAESTA